MTVIIPVLAAMYLGASFNLNLYQKGAADIYDKSILKDKVQVIQRSMTKSLYKLVESSSDARDFLDVDGELSLRIKSGKVDLEGSGSYLKDTSSRDNFVELLVRVQHETITETIPSSLEPSKDWMDRPESQVGTHFVRSIIYGGELIASVRLNAINKQEREKIKAAVTANLHFTGTLDLGAKGNFEKLRRDLGGSYREEIQTTATVPPTNPPQSVEQLMRLVNTYPQDVMQLNDGKGRPLRAELYPLSAFKRNYGVFFTNSAVTGLLDDIDAKYDDLRIAQAEFTDWSNSLPFDVSDEDYKKVEDYYAVLQNALDEFNNAISKMDTSLSGSANQFDKAFQAYGLNGDNVPQRFQRWLWILKNEVSNTSLEWEKPKGYGESYIRWGSGECVASDTIRLVEGTAAGPQFSSFGGGENILCLSNQASTAPYSSRKSVSYLLPVGYFGNDQDDVRTLSCSKCYIPQASSVVVFPSRTSCPPDWRLEYKGIMMGETFARTGHTFVCLDVTTEGLPMVDKDKATKLGAVWADDDNVVSCIVCSHF